MKIFWRRLLTAPTTRIESIEGESVQLRIDGLACSSVCAARTKQALLGIDGVRRVSVDFERGTARIEGTPASPDAYERALVAVVAGMPMRRWLERASRRLGFGESACSAAELRS